jgi:hypothetical protein
MSHRGNFATQIRVHEFSACKMPAGGLSRVQLQSSFYIFFSVRLNSKWILVIFIFGFFLNIYSYFWLLSVVFYLSFCFESHSPRRSGISLVASCNCCRVTDAYVTASRRLPRKTSIKTSGLKIRHLKFRYQCYQNKLFLPRSKY